MLRGAAPISLEPRVFDLSVYLARNRISKADLIASVRGGLAVSDSTFTGRIDTPRERLSAIAAETGSHGRSGAKVIPGRDKSALPA